MRDQERILIVDDALDTAEVLRRNLELHGYAVSAAPGTAQAVELLTQRPVDLVLTDLKMPGASGLELIRHVRANYRDTDVLMITGYPSVETAVSAIRSGAVNYLAKPFTEQELLGAVRSALHSLRSRQAMNRKPEALRTRFPGLIGQSPPMLAMYELMDRTSRSSANVLLLGEAGTGKELVGRAIHYRSARSKLPFVPAHCGAIPEDRLDAELFGRADDRGRRTGGLVQAAHRGTLYLDQISAASPTSQERILRWLEDGSLPSATGRKQRFDVRVMAAADRDIHALTDEGTFRKALLYQLGVVEIEIPPLRERGEDIWLLAHAFAAKTCKELRCPLPQFSDRVLAALRDHVWPGNVRELATTIRRLVVMSDGKLVDAPDLPSLLRYSAKGPEVARTLEAVEDEHIRRVMSVLGSNQSRAAEVLGIDRKTLRAKLRRRL